LGSFYGSNGLVWVVRDRYINLIELCCIGVCQFGSKSGSLWNVFDEIDSFVGQYCMGTSGKWISACWSVPFREPLAVGLGLDIQGPSGKSVYIRIFQFSRHGEEKGLILESNRMGECQEPVHQSYRALLYRGMAFVTDNVKVQPECFRWNLRFAGQYLLGNLWRIDFLMLVSTF
jgi:hypothetical protein